MTSPQLSLVVLARDHLDLTRACVESLRANTDVPYELILVDNGSEPEAAEWARSHGDRSVLNEENRGFAIGMNQGLAEATGEYVAFLNNDTLFPERWASPLLETATEFPHAGIVAPAVTAAGNPATVRSQPGPNRVIFEPFGHLPSGVAYLMRTDVMRRLGEWNEDYHLATGEDLDLLWTVWANGLEVVLDERVLVQHVSEATRRGRPDMEEIRKRNLHQFLDRWERSDPKPMRLTEYPEASFDANLRHAAAGAIWLRRLVAAREEASAGRRFIPEGLRQPDEPKSRRRRFQRPR